MGQGETGIMGASTEELQGEMLAQVPLGDLMRGERATMGKSLQDVEADLRIRASYIAAIENADLSAFSSHGFIAGYVRSYARYLGLDPEWVFTRFCEETGFSGVTGFGGDTRRARSAQKMRQSIQTPKKAKGSVQDDPRFSSRKILFDGEDGFLPRLEAGALGSLFVLSVVLLGVGYGAWVLLNDFQRVQFAPVTDTPVALTAMDPLPMPQGSQAQIADATLALPQEETAPDSAAMERLYRPTLLEAPMLVPRDRAIGTLNPSTTGAFAQSEAVSVRPDEMSRAIAAMSDEATSAPVTQQPRDEVVLFAVRPSWIRVTTADGTVLFEGTLNAGDSYTVPEMDSLPFLRAGNSGALYFALNSVTFGPAGVGTSVVKDVPISADEIETRYAIANATADPQLPEVAQLVLERLAQGE